MLNDPASFSPYAYRESTSRRCHMDAKQLEFQDGSFDAVFSLSSIEHFGSWADIRVPPRRSDASCGPEERRSS